LIKKSNSVNNFQIDTEMIADSHMSDCGIVYCSSRFECESLARHLVNAGFTAAPYHTGMTDVQRESFQGNWILGLCQVILKILFFKC
jgi:superfamily II DNA helicase RecQ